MSSRSTYEHHSPPEVTIVFEVPPEVSARLKINPRGIVSIGRYGNDVPPGMTQLPPSKTEIKGVDQYYMIDSTIDSERIEIRILAHSSDPDLVGKIYQWTGEYWDELEFQESRNVGKYKLIIGVTDHLSGFGIRT
jgi:hypothetical protein